jgi:hypothetical protein
VIETQTIRMDGALLEDWDELFVDGELIELTAPIVVSGTVIFQAADGDEPTPLHRRRDVRRLGPQWRPNLRRTRV